MKIGIIGMSNLCLMPYLFTYTNFLTRNNIKFDVIYWNRRGLAEQYDFTSYAYNFQIKDCIHKLKKLKYILNFATFVKKILDKNRYDFLIILTSVPAVLFSRVLLKNYSGKYIIDVRDYTYEHIFAYSHVFARVLCNSALNVISSPGFIEFLPYKQAVLCHNMSFNKEGNRNIRSDKCRSVKPIKICYVGGIGYYDQCVHFINTIANDIRFEFHFYGMGDYNFELKDYCINGGIENVLFHGAYKPDEKELIYGQTDVIFNVYGNDNDLLKYALSNKFYDAAWYKIPIIVSPDTSMRTYSKSLSFAVDFNTNNLATKIFKWYDSINWKILENDAREIINEAHKDNESFLKKIHEVTL